MEAKHSFPDRNISVSEAAKIFGMSLTLFEKQVLPQYNWVIYEKKSSPNSKNPHRMVGLYQAQALLNRWRQDVIK